MVLYILRMVIRPIKKFEKALKIHLRQQIFEKSTLRTGLTHASKRAVFLLKTCFKRLLETFLRVVWPCSIYLGGRLRPYLYSRKRIRVIEHIDQKIFTKNQFSLKKTWFEPSSLDTTVGTLPSKFGKFLRKWTQNFRFEKLWGHIKKLTASWDLVKSPPQTVCRSDTNWLL